MVGTLFAGFRRWVGLTVLGGMTAFGTQDALAGGFDFRLLELEVVGQSAFFDDFEDGLRFSAPPTSILLDLGNFSTNNRTVTVESGGALIFTDTDGARQFTSENGIPLVNDGVRYDNVPRFLDGAGNYTILATLAPVTPTESYQAFLLDLTAFDVSPQERFLFGFDWRSDQLEFGSPCGSGFQAWAFVADAYLACNGIDPAAVTGDIVMKLTVNDTTNELNYLYSTDGGATFLAMSEFEFSGAQVANFPPLAFFGSGSGVTLNIVAEGLLPEPHVALLLLIAAGAVLRRKRG